MRHDWKWVLSDHEQMSLDFLAATLGLGAINKAGVKMGDVLSLPKNLPCLTKDPVSGAFKLEPCMLNPNNMNQPNESELQSQISGPLNVEVDDLSLIARWCHNPDLPEAWSRKVQAFKEELRAALDRPGTVKPELYEKWSDDSSYETQEEVQQRLQEIWDACFG